MKEIAKATSLTCYYCFLATLPLFVILLGFVLIDQKNLSFVLNFFFSIYLAFVIHELGHVMAIFLLLGKEILAKTKFLWNFSGMSMKYTNDNKSKNIAIALGGITTNLTTVLVVCIFQIQADLLVFFSLFVAIFAFLPGRSDLEMVRKNWSR
jgi:hypothetical protein